jgi:pimeloyl-ACP methyl ester carboxylesterase
MGLINRRSISDLRGMVRLATEATVGVTDLVEKVHHTIQLGQAPLGVSRAGSTGGLTGLVYRSIRGTTKLVGKGLDAGMVPVSALFPDQGSSSSTRNAFVSALNGLYGDHLLATGNPLAIEMAILNAGQVPDLEQAQGFVGAQKETSVSGKVILFVHGLCLNEAHWSREGLNRGLKLSEDLGYTPLYLRYNTGLPISDNGHELANMLESLLSDWPCAVTELVIIGHSMGGLLARSAYHQGKLLGHDWIQHTEKMVSIGSPHQGAPLERGGNWLNLAMDMSPYTTPFTRIAEKRSAGIADLRHGSISGHGQGFIPLPTDVSCYAMAATLGKKRSRISERLIGDGLVPLDSALGKNKDPQRALDIPESHQWVGFETGHIELLGHSGVYAQLHDWLQ